MVDILKWTPIVFGYTHTFTIDFWHENENFSSYSSIENCEKSKSVLSKVLGAVVTIGFISYLLLAFYFIKFLHLCLKREKLYMKKNF